MNLLEKTLETLRKIPNRYTSENEVHNAVNSRLMVAGILCVAEWRLTEKDRIDFHLPGPPKIGIEVKCRGGEMAHLRQLYRYAPHYDHLILFTTQASAPEDQDMIAIRPDHVCRLHVVNLNLNL